MSIKIKDGFIQLNKTEAENIYLKFKVGFLKSENKRLKKKIKEIKNTLD